MLTLGGEMKRRFTKVMSFIMTMVMLFMVPWVPSLAETTVNVEKKTLPF
jgi:hypothetical protein